MRIYLQWLFSLNDRTCCSFVKLCQVYHNKKVMRRAVEKRSDHGCRNFVHLKTGEIETLFFTSVPVSRLFKQFMSWLDVKFGENSSADFHFCVSVTNLGPSSAVVFGSSSSPTGVDHFALTAPSVFHLSGLGSALMELVSSQTQWSFNYHLLRANAGADGNKAQNDDAE